MKKKLTLNLCFALAAALMTQSAVAQFVITDAGATAPTPGPNDVYAVFSSVQNNDGLNYYWDNGSPNGETFTTGASSYGYTLTSLAVRTAGNGGSWGSGPAASWGASQTFTLTIYSVDDDGNATPVATNSAVGALSAQGDWLKWSGLSVPLLPNTNYAYTLQNGDTSSGGNWEELANNDTDPYPGGEVCNVPLGGGPVQYGYSGVSDAVFDIGLTPGTAAGGTVTVADAGTTAPTPGANDIAQLSPAVIPIQNNYGLNYYWDSGPGQVFTTPNSALPWVVTNLFVQTGGGGGGGQLNAQAFVLRLYSVTGGTTASLIYSNSYTSALSAEGDWLQFSGMNAVLQPNHQYAYSVDRGANGSWEQMADYDGHPYAGGKICLIPVNGGAINYGSQNATNFADAAFDVGLTAPLVFGILPTYTPNVSPLNAGTTVTLNEAALGSGTLSYQWQTDGGSGGALTNIPGATSSNLVVNTTGFAAGTYNYAVAVTTTSGGGMSVTSPVLPLSIAPASAPVIITDTTPTPDASSSYVGLSQSFSVSVSGTLPIAYQWYVASDASGTGATAIPGATGATLTLTNLQLSNTGFYAVVATNAVSPFSTASTWTQLTVLPASQMLFTWLAPMTFNGLTAGQILTGTLPSPFSFYEAAEFDGGSATINVTNSGNVYSFYDDGSTVSIAGQSGFSSGSWLVGGNTTGDTNLDYVLNHFAYDGNAGTASIHTISLHNLMVGSNYCVEIFALDDRPPGVGRYTSFQNPADNADVSATFGDPDNMYVIGTFTAPSTDLDIQQNLLPGGAGCVSAVIVGAVATVSTNAATANFNVTAAGQTLNFTWAADHQGWQLYTNSVGLGATNSWYPVPGSAAGTSQSVTVDPTKPQVFFQLRYP